MAKQMGVASSLRLDSSAQGKPATGHRPDTATRLHRSSSRLDTSAVYYGDNVDVKVMLDQILGENSFMEKYCDFCSGIN